MKNKISLFCILFLFLCFTGCSKEEAANTEGSPDTEVTVTAFDRSGGFLDDMMLAPVLMGDKLYFWKGSWDNESKRWSDTVICRRAGGEAEAVEIALLGDRELLCFAVDEGQNLYYLYAEYSDEGKALFFQKDMPDGKVAYNVPVPIEAGTQILYDIEQNDRISQGTADPLGRVIFRSPSGSLYLFTEFQIRGHIAKQGTVADGVWTPEEYLGLGIQKPEALLACQLSTYMMMENALYADMGSFVDWQDRRCAFDSERFINILKSVRQVTDGKQTPDLMEYGEHVCQWLHDGQVMTEFFSIYDVQRYVEYRDAYGDFAEFMGYPNSEGITYYRFMPDYMLAMNSASEHKEGVWAFLEFLFSEDYQSAVSSFPVRRDSFEAHIAEQVKEWEGLSKNYSPGSRINPISRERWQEYPQIDEQDVEALMYLVENAYWDNTFDDMRRIIFEEAGSFWSGNKTAEEAAGIIQNRVQLYLDE